MCPVIHKIRYTAILLLETYKMAKIQNILRTALEIVYNLRDRIII